MQVGLSFLDSLSSSPLCLEWQFSKEKGSQLRSALFGTAASLRGLGSRAGPQRIAMSDFVRAAPLLGTWELRFLIRVWQAKPNKPWKSAKAQCSLFSVLAFGSASASMLSILLS
ncbi:hypothetical protein QVD17_42411 [Tagetes erecta]|uniref:Uncharacterized protein n=1 Tax=Tagetes erecta TaxID=13708 RepID=A0AAD8JM94_TARER|nr:hypothetical protein QVD17_42411 [Tagetes erecta]